MPELLVRNLRRLKYRFPRRLRAFGAPVLGGLCGLIGGIPGFLIGLLLGYLLGELIVQSRSDSKILDYFENPSSQNFYEGEPGLAAWCALAVLVVSKNHHEPSFERTLKQVVLGACHAFTDPRSEPGLMEHFSRLAWSRKENLNSDLLAESLASRRLSKGDAGNLGRCLYALADGEKARSYAREIRLILDPFSQDNKEPERSDAESEKDPWRILGLAPGTPLRELKAHYRRLAKQFHPDELQLLDEKQRETAARAFMAIKEAYKQISDPPAKSG